MTQVTLTFEIPICTILAYNFYLKLYLVGNRDLLGLGKLFIEIMISLQVSKPWPKIVFLQVTQNQY